VDRSWENGGIFREEVMPHSYASKWRTVIVDQVLSGQRVLEVAAGLGIVQATVFRWVARTRSTVGS
jgi:hypothetical protein